MNLRINASHTLAERGLDPYMTTKRRNPCQIRSRVGRMSMRQTVRGSRRWHLICGRVSRRPLTISRRSTRVYFRLIRRSRVA
jgi:hypothetical protein